MSYLLDTNIISELRKTERINPRVRSWWSLANPSDFFLSVLTLGEIHKGIERLEIKGKHPAKNLRQWLALLSATFAGRLLPVDGHVAEIWGRINAQRTYPVIDSLLAATAIANGFIMVTRNTTDMKGLGVILFNPFE